MDNYYTTLSVKKDTLNRLILIQSELQKERYQRVGMDKVIMLLIDVYNELKKVKQDGKTD
jgi:3-deoxy-D-manno-octulosonic-acid transferase